MFACIVEDKKTYLTTTFFCGCEDIMREFVEYGHGEFTSFRTSEGYRRCSTDSAKRMNEQRLSNQLELIDRAIREFFLKGGSA